MLPDTLYKKIMPISSKNVIIKVSVFLYIYIRVLFQLLKDFIDKPDVLIVSRRFINRIFPWSYKLILNKLKKSGTRIIWDFDDQIIESREVSKDGFEYLERLADYIVIASNENRNLISQSYLRKVLFLPTTDGDMYNLLNETVEITRKEKLEEEIRLIWIGTSVSLKFLAKIISGLRNKDLECQKKLILTVVCDKPLVVEDNDKLEIRNIKWERDVSINELLNSHIGLMPLEDTKFTRGKGGFKLIQYMSVGLPIIGSPIGINKSIISQNFGRQVDIEDTLGWCKAIDEICHSKDKWLSFSHNASEEWYRKYNYSANLENWKHILY